MPYIFPSLKQNFVGMYQYAMAGDRSLACYWNAILLIKAIIPIDLLSIKYFRQKSHQKIHISNIALQTQQDQKISQSDPSYLFLEEVSDVFLLTPVSKHLLAKEMNAPLFE